MATMMRPVGEHIRDWRQRRRMSQLDLALEADVSARHVSFLETGRARPSRDMLLHLADRLDIPLRERNALLLAAGFAPTYRERPLDDPALAAARAAVEQLLKAHEPYPALAVDRHWTMVAANRAVALLLADVDPALLQPPVNPLRVSLHPDGLSKRIVNLGEWRAHLVHRLQRQQRASGDPGLAALVEELAAYPAPDQTLPVSGGADVVVPLRLATSHGELSLISTTTVFGTPLDVTLSELALETFFPADEATRTALQRLMAADDQG